MWQGRATWAEIDLDAIEHNVRGLIRQAGGQARLLAAVKANAYGHGATPVARAALRAGAFGVAVACADEGVQLRQAGVDAPVLVMGAIAPWEAEMAVAQRLTPTVTTHQLALALSAAASQQSRTVPVHLKVDTGMGRFGLAPEDLEPFHRMVASLPGLEVEGLFTHFACADEPDKSFTLRQFGLFTQVAGRIPRPPLLHVANSAAVLDLPELALDLVRTGIAVYGLYPSREVRRTVDLRPALSLKSRVARLHDLRAGDGVSYGLTWRADRPCRVALVPCGYGDGLRRGLSNRGSALIRGRRAPIRGRVCMDQCVVDVSDLPQVAIGDEVVLIGRQGDDAITADEVAELLTTINYEVVTGIAPRVPRVYVRRGQVVEVETLVAAGDDRASLSQPRR